MAGLLTLCRKQHLIGNRGRSNLYNYIRLLTSALYRYDFATFPRSYCLCFLHRRIEILLYSNATLQHFGNATMQPYCKEMPRLLSILIIDNIHYGIYTLSLLFIIKNVLNHHHVAEQRILQPYCHPAYIIAA